MATKFYADISGNYVGGFDGAQPPPNSVQVPFAPVDARYTWNGSNWIIPPAAKDEIIDEKREAQVKNDGVTLEDKVSALWLLAKGDKTEFDNIEAIIAKAATDNPK